MNAGTDYEKAKRQAQANADYTKTPRWLHGYGNTWWISSEPAQDALTVGPVQRVERIDPTEKPRGYV